MTQSTLPAMSAPPVNEVVCGISFERAASITTQLVGAYWLTRKDAFPATETKLALGSVVSFEGDQAPPLRTWLVSPDQDFILQIQDNRFILNWRKRGAHYPRFEGSICERVLSEFETFRRFCSVQSGIELQPSMVELAKVNFLYQGRHWSNWQDLFVAVPLLQQIAFLNPDLHEPTISLRLVDRTSRGPIVVAIETGVENATQTRLLKIENRVVRAHAGNLRHELVSMNAELNEMFGRQIPLEIMLQRFDRGE